MFNVRVAGSGNTVLLVAGQRVAFLQMLSETPPKPLASIETIQGIGDKYPVDYAKCFAYGAGRIVLSLTELWNAEVWQRLRGMASMRTAEDVFEKMAPIQCQKMVKGPSGITRIYAYLDCIVTSITEDERITNDSLSMTKDIELTYLRRIKL